MPRLFLHKGRLYALGMSQVLLNGPEELVISYSEDSGLTWREPLILFEKEKSIFGCGVLRSPTSHTVYKGRLWFNVEHEGGKGWYDGGLQGYSLMSIPEDADLTNTANWTFSKILRYSTDFPGAVKGGNPFFLEGNMVVSPDGRLFDFLRYNTEDAEPDRDKAALLEVDTGNPEKAPVFYRIIDFPGGMNLFNIIFDPDTHLYVSLIARVTLPWAGQRNILSLSISKDLYTWNVVHDVINLQDSGWSEGCELAGFHSTPFFIEKGDIYLVSRTAYGGARSYHDANRVTFHKVENYIQYCNYGGNK
jgi:hypothetical protein